MARGRRPPETSSSGNGSSVELLTEFRVRLLAGRPPDDPAASVEHVERGEASDAVTARDRTDPSVARPLDGVRTRIDERRERQPEPGVEREHARSVLAVGVDGDEGGALCER